MQDDLGERLEAHVSPEVWHRMQDLREIAERVEAEEAAEWRARAAKYVRLNKKQLAALADTIEPYHPKHNPDPREFLRCGECGETAVVVTEDGDIGVCTNSECREVHEITHCLRCGEPMAEGGMLCDSCEVYLADQ